ncbi:choline ABC transporter ATP-binding protein [Alginatibacterium sediminis]|uniref:Choline ABC transporter ATP-binding protein n=1 Tax=Alginatibacterium sediminis TaxID=2164068 RepID=A0A420EDF9_9ALTE|nr:choline ABC transporter ATP-binding protein [Alginatibacterium sediminis]RKF18708.1 choline ABC transporter ATP-binding protein [Alginatibacterium sediminis]
MSAISIKNLDVIFGHQNGKSLAMLDNGSSRQEIIDATGDVVGVHDVSLDIEKGEICVLMGLSGSGKSSLLRAINGLNTVTRGSLTVRDGEQDIDLATCDKVALRHLRTNRISMVFQKFALMPWLSVLDNAAFGLELQGIAKTERRCLAEERLEMVGLSEWKDNFPHELSGGMQQRVGLARAFTMDSDILLMDEPFSALDPLIRTQLQDELLELQRKLNKTIVFVSHDLDEALKLGNTIAIMESGRLIQQGKPEDIVLNPKTKYVSEFVAHTNPLNVLCGRSLMTHSSTLPKQDGKLLLSEHQQSFIELDSTGQVAAVTRQESLLSIHVWHEGDRLQSVNIDSQVIAPADISMREALEIRYRTGQAVLLADDGVLVGILDDNEFYHALLGKHFSFEASA